MNDLTYQQVLEVVAYFLFGVLSGLLLIALPAALLIAPLAR